MLKKTLDQTVLVIAGYMAHLLESWALVENCSAMLHIALSFNQLHY